MEVSYLDMRMRITPLVWGDILDDLMHTYISKFPESRKYTIAASIERAFVNQYGCSFYAVPKEQLPKALDELCRILHQCEKEDATVYSNRDSFFKNLIYSVGNGVTETSTDDLLIAADLLYKTHKEDIFRFLMRANSLTRPHHRYSHNEVGIRIDQANTESSFTPNNFELLSGSSLSDEHALDYAKKHLRREKYCLVRDWLWVDLEFNEITKPSLEKQRVQPKVIYAHTIVHDSQKRWATGAYARSSLLKEHEQNFLFRTHECVYLLLGPGARVSTTAETAALIF